MDDTSAFETSYSDSLPAVTSLAPTGLEGLQILTDKVTALDQTLQDLHDLCDANTKKRVDVLRKSLADLEPSVTMIGQVKAGKTSLLNAMIGWPDLLPADVNPWTSVVTSLHLSPTKRALKTSASFEFFQEDEWDNFLTNGGRLGELASRAGANDEMDKLREQLAAMQQKSRARLGKKFELLMGQTHEYGEFDQDLIERYVCLGEVLDDQDPAAQQDNQGRYADITKSADLFLHRPDLPAKMCFRDTPGVNDTFMMREQITIRAIRDSRLCVVVLSAHQALSSVDMALIRMITTIQSRDVVIFVNRIDELPHPDTQVPEIRDSIVQTLATLNGPKDAQIIFGSAYWANASFDGTVNDLQSESAAALAKWAAAKDNDGLDRDTFSDQDLLWQMSGIPALFTALTERIMQGEAAEAIEKLAQSASNIATGVQLGNHAVIRGQQGDISLNVDRAELTKDIEALEAKSLEHLDIEFDHALETFQNRLGQSHRNFLDRATSSLLSHLEQKGADKIWEYDPMGLRMMLTSAYSVFGTRTQKIAERVFEKSASNISALYATTFDGQVENTDIATPIFARVPPPVFLGQTIALDLKGPWWKSWWMKRKGRQAFSENFHNLIKAETDPILQELAVAQTSTIHQQMRVLVCEFFADQRAVLSNIAAHASLSADEMIALISGPDAQENPTKLANVVQSLSALHPAPKKPASSAKMIAPMPMPQKVEPDMRLIEKPTVKPRIALMGEFSSGKSTLTNLLLGADPLPTRVTATQLPPVWVSQGDAQNTYEDHDGNEFPFELDDIAQIDLAETRLIRVYLQSEILELCDLIDMPGISDPNMSADVWGNVIDEADSVIWCTPATQAWRQSEAAVWASLPARLHNKSLLVVSRMDKLTSEQDREKVLNRVKRETAGNFFGLHGVSLTQAIAAQDDQDAWDASGAETFANHFIDLLAVLPEMAGLRPQEQEAATNADPAPDATELGITRPKRKAKTPRPAAEDKQTLLNNLFVETGFADAPLPAE